MGPDLDLKNKSGSIHSPAFSRQKVPEPRKDYIGDACGMETSRIEQTHFSDENENVEVNITGSTNSGQALVVEDSREDATESSSSFGHTESDTQNVPSFSDPEVESCLCADNASSSMSNDYFESPPRRKKGVTSHWRKFIHPLMWRCKWIELRLKQLQSQELKYEKELAAYNYRKQLDFAHLTLDGTDIKSVPISGRMHRNKIMKRKKRKRVEEKYDLASYMSNHSLFSYYEQKDRTVVTCLKDVHGAANGGNIDDIEFKMDDLWSYVDYENSDKSLDDIIQKIEAVQSQVHKLKTRIDKVIKENSGKFDSRTQLDKPGTPQHEPEYQTVDPLIPGNASLTDEGFNLLVEMTDKPRIEDLREEIKDGTLIQNQEAKKELQVSESDFSVEDVVPNIHSTLKVCSTSKSNVPKNKRKRRNKSASWNRMSFG